ncbi:retinol dehydrogenase 12-like [Pollicipes pollicipes]|uniref:retinol dehydrogenase 12-like n=1 Tax=Pollicipes pollicipes TaxID=41117 RepID=UPI001884C41F|nr:retinol dehydrogenase 12-like [Pollicipes pollicipes]
MVTTKANDGQTALVAGANTGLGLETARGLYERGARVLLAVRSDARGQAACERLEWDAADPAINEREQRLDLLINNAGVAASERSETEDGFETTFGVNHLGHFLLTLLLLGKLKASAPARVVVLSSDAHKTGRMHFDDLQLTRGYSLWKAYAQSKLANVLFVRELSRRLAGTSVTVYAVHPGTARTEIGRNLSGWQRCLVWPFRPLFKTPAAGARTSLFCALDPELAGASGHYYKR